MDQAQKPNDDVQRQLNELRSFIATHEDVQAYLAHSAAWADGQAEEAQRSRATAWRVATAACGVTALALVVALTSIATAFRPAPPPEILSVNGDTGITERPVTLKDFQMTASEATIRRNIATFMRARESYTWDTAEENYYDAAAFMSQPLQSQWAAYWDAGNPKSPMNYYKKDTKVRIALGAITINKNSRGEPVSARASFTRTITQNDLPQGEPTQWIATMSYGWVNAPMKERDRRINDLGFEIRDYQVDADIGGTRAGTPAARAVELAPVAPTPQAMTAPAAGAKP